MGLPLRHFGKLGTGQARQRQILEEDLHELLLAQREAEVVFALALVAGLSLAGAALATLGALDPVAPQVVLVAGVHHVTHAALAVVEDGFGQVLLGNADLLATLKVAHAAAVDGSAHGLGDLVLVAAHEALAVADRLVLASQSAVDDVELHESSLGRESGLAPGREAHCQATRHAGRACRWINSTCEPAGTTRTAGEPVCRCSLWRPCG